MNGPATRLRTPSWAVTVMAVIMGLGGTFALVSLQAPATKGQNAGAVQNISQREFDELLDRRLESQRARAEKLAQAILAQRPDPRTIQDQLVNQSIVVEGAQAKHQNAVLSRQLAEITITKERAGNNFPTLLCTVLLDQA